MAKAEILRQFAIFSMPTGGIGGWLTANTDDVVFDRLGRIADESLPAVQLNQLLVLGQEAPVEDGFFRYYWLEASKGHPYDLPPHKPEWLNSNGKIVSLDHLQWGLRRLYVDGLLYFGNVRTAFRKLRDLPITDIENFFALKRFDTEAIMRRGPALPLRFIPKDDRYLISEMACKTYGDEPGDVGGLRSALVAAFKSYVAAGHTSPTIRQLLEDDLSGAALARQPEFIFSVDEVLDETVESESDLDEHFGAIAAKFSVAREAALDSLNGRDLYS